MSSPPLVVGRYRLDALLRADVDPSTWRAMDLTAGRTVRVCLVGGETGSAARSRRAAVHPGLLPVLDVVRLRDGVSPPLAQHDPRGETFVVLEPVEGETLEELVVRKGALDPVRTVRLILAIANGLAGIHAAGSVHGGVLPLAIEVRTMEDGGPRLGLAGVHDAAMAYASPSRLCDGGPSTHDDAWGLLASLYFAVTGGPPFAAESPQALARRVLGGRPVPIKTETTAQQDMQRMFERGFSRTAGQRYPDVGTLRDDLRAWLAKHGQASDAPLVSMVPPPGATASTVTAKKGTDVADEAYPRVFPTTTSARHKTVPWGFDPTPSLPPRPVGTLPETPAARAPASLSPETPRATPRPRPEPRAPSERPSPPPPSSWPPAPSRPPAASSRPPPSSPPNDETARFSREQLAMLEREAGRAASANEPVAARVDAMASTMMAQASATTERKLPAAQLAATPRKVAIEAAAPGEVVDRAAPPPRPRSVPPRGERKVALAFGAGAVIAAVAATAFFLMRSSATPPVPPAPVAVTTSTEPPHPRPVASAVAPSSALPSATPIASASAATKPSADDLLACVGRSFPADTFDPDADLSFVCSERDGRKGSQKLRRAIVAGGRGARITEAMREWSRYRWFELPVYATVRARCCSGVPPVDPPAVSTTCSAPRETIHAVATAAASGADLDGALRQYRRLVTCLMDSGDFPAFGQDAPIGGGEEASFRAVVARGKR